MGRRKERKEGENENKGTETRTKTKIKIKGLTDKGKEGEARKFHRKE